jgi:hypothetical protein
MNENPAPAMTTRSCGPGDRLDDLITLVWIHSFLPIFFAALSKSNHRERRENIRYQNAMKDFIPSLCALQIILRFTPSLCLSILRLRLIIQPTFFPESLKIEKESNLSVNSLKGNSFGEHGEKLCVLCGFMFNLFMIKLLTSFAGYFDSGPKAS